MKIRKYSQLVTMALVVLLLFPAVVMGQDEKPAERGSMEFGVRQIWGEVFGRPDLPFEPSLGTSKYNEYRDLRNGFFLRRFDVTLDNLLGTKTYVNAQSRSAIYRDQSYLVTVGQYGTYKFQFRYDEIPHTYTNTARTLYTETAPGVFTIVPSIRNTLETTAAADLPATVLAQVPSMTFITPSIRRKTASGLFSYDVTPEWNVSALFSREHQAGTRPIGLLFNTSPSASATSGFGVEVPEPIDYFNNTFKAGVDYGRKNWGLQIGYLGSFFENNIGELVFDNPFRTSDCIASPCAAGTPGPATGLMDLYPDNQAHYLTFAGAMGLGEHVRAMANITPGWLRQDDAFVPYTSNLLRLAQTGPLPATSLNGDKQTLAMNFTGVATPLNDVQVKVAYRHYDYNNNTPVLELTPVQGDLGAPGTADNRNRATSFNKKNVEVTGNWFFAKRSSLKLGYEAEWFDRTHRDVENSLEHSLIAAVDLSPVKELLVRVAYRHQNREPEHYEDEQSVNPATDEIIPCEATALAEARANFVFPGIHPCARRFDEAARIRDRGDILVQYDPFSRLSLSAFASTIQDDYNRRGGTNSATPLNFLTGSAATTGPYFLYGLLKDLSYNIGFDATYTVSDAVSLFAEYSHERYHRRMTSRYRAPQATSGTGGCGPSSTGVANRGPCDSANNDWESTARDFADVWSTGLDLYLGKKVYLTTYYSLAAGKGRVHTRALGTQTADFLTSASPATNDPDRFVMTTTNSATDYPAPCLVTGQPCTDIPNTVSRSHEVGAIFKFKLTKNILPKVEYRYQQFDNRDYQTTAMTPYMGCVATTTTVANGCPVLGPSIATSIPSPFYPFSVVGDTSAARYIFLGVDQPSLRAHYVAATLEYHF